LRQDPGRAAESPAEARTCGNGVSVRTLSPQANEPRPKGQRCKRGAREARRRGRGR
jgi:hypothetical protein